MGVGSGFGLPVAHEAECVRIGLQTGRREKGGEYIQGVEVRKIVSIREGELFESESNLRLACSCELLLVCTYSRNFGLPGADKAECFKN